ncbi:MAG: hypothetical protein SH809_07950 [Rhodothermales bacterium]|nr:hypothetical protein [Rhodothermales bacterium]
MQTLFVSFGNQEVAVAGEVEEVLVPLAHNFRELLVPVPYKLLDTLTVRREGDRYVVDGADQFGDHDGTLHGAMQCLKFEIVFRFVREHRELLWLHAGAAAKGGRAVVMCGTWGRGKSTLVSNLCLRGWSYLSDDIVPVSLETGELVPFPLTPQMREHAATEDDRLLSPGEVAQLEKRTIELREGQIDAGRCAIAALIFPQYSPEADMRLVRTAPASATLELLQNCLNLKMHRGEAVRYLGKLVERTPAFHLPYRHGEAAAQLLIHTHAQGFPF